MCKMYFLLFTYFFISIALSSCGGQNKVDTPYGATECVGKEMESVKSDFESSGFLNISEEEICDLDITEKDKYGIVESVSVNGVSDFNGNEEFKNLSKVLIKYHTFKNIEIPFSSEEIKNIDTETLAKTFKEKGFVDITIEEEYDLDPDENIEFENEVIINKTDSFEKSSAFPQNAQIKITTHKPYKKYTLKVIIDFIPNLLFSKYDVEFKVANNIETLEHGKDGEFEYKLKEGEYTLVFKSTESSSVNGKVKVNLTGDTEVSYKIECDDDKVDIETLYIENKGEIGEYEAMIPANSSDYAYANYQEVEKAFKDAGFTNVKTEALYDIVWGWTEEGEIEKISVDGKTEFKRGDIIAKDCPIVITYHLSEKDRPVGENEIRIPFDDFDFWDEYYDVVEKSLKEAGFTNIKFETISIFGSSMEQGLVDNVTINGNSVFYKGEIFEKNAEIIITYYDNAENDPNPVFYSNNNYATAKKGNTGVFAYKDKGKLYDIYWIIDFDEGYVYYFTHGEGDNFCDRLKIESGDLNSRIVITYHDSGSTWSYGLHFKYVEHPETLIMNDNNGFEYEYTTTDLNAALKLRGEKKITDY